ncbi:hypothetical protein ACGF0D_42960 [Kitasatospora sp. NPDC048298]|uniref:hypothetical protein n=1 Tax=Kitasatospora sp. NPDC048298 TaxID=3364049 RepID=UPI0037204CBA
MTVPPPPNQPPTVGMPPENNVVDAVVAEWWRLDGPRIPGPAVPPVDLAKAPAPVPGTTVHTPVPIGAGAAVPSMEQAAQTFWAPFGTIMSEQASAIASQVGEQVTQLLTETAAQRAAREQVEYETLLAAQRARGDSALGKVGETKAQQAARHRTEDLLGPGPVQPIDLVHLVDRLADRLSETPQDRAARLETERELARQRARAQEDRVREAAGETPKQRDLRHRQQRLADEHEAKDRARRQRRKAARAAGPTDRTRRFRRWCVLTAISAVGGYSVGLVPLIATGGPWVGLVLAAGGWAVDLFLRDLGRLRVSEVRGAGPLVLLVLARIPVASGLAVAAGLAPLITALHLFH